MPELRRRYDLEFKAGAARIVLETRRSVAEVVRELGVGEGTLGNWVEDLYSRRMLGFATSERHPTAELAEAALNMAATARGGDVKGVIFHSDRGSQAGLNRWLQLPLSTITVIEHP